MELGLSNSLLAGDPRLIDHIVGEVKSQGIFDKFRKECIADVDTKPAYQNLRTRVESSVNSFLNKQIWRTDLNKNQLRETLRKHIHDAPYLEVGVERIVDQVVNPKIYSVFMPQIEDVVYKFLGIERPKVQRNGICDLKDLLPKDLDPVSPESDRNSLKDISLESVDENLDEVINVNDRKSNSNKFDDKIQDLKCNSIKKEVINIENGENDQVVMNAPIKLVLNNSFKSDETNKTEEEEEESPVFEPIDIMNLNESNMSNDSHLSGISELTSHRSQSPDFITEFSRDNFDCSNQDSQLSKVSSNSRLSIVTDFGSSNHASTPLPESKEDFKYNKDNFKVVREFETNKDNKFNFEVIKSKDNSKISNSSKENSHDAHEYKDSKIKDESKAKCSRDKYDSRTSRDKDRNSKRRHSKSDKYSRSKSKDKNESEDSKENSSKYKESKLKDVEKKDEIKDLKDLYKEKIRELREKKELTEKEKLVKDNKDCTKITKDVKEKKEISSKEKDDYKKNHKSSSTSSKNSSSHNNKISRGAESKDSRNKNNGKHDDRRHSNGKSESKSSTKNKKDSKIDIKSDSRCTDRSLKDKKRRDEKKSKSTDDHSSLRKNSNDRRSTDRDGSNGSSSKYSHKSSYGANNTSGKFGPSTNLAKDTSKDNHSSSEASDSVHDNLKIIFGGSQYIKGSNNLKNLDVPPKRLDPGSTEICLPLKKRPLHNDKSLDENQLKKTKLENKKTSKKKIEKDIFRIDTDVTSVPDEERVQIIEIPDEEYEEPYPDMEPILSLEETKKIILDAEPIHPIQSKLSEMERSIRQSLSEMMSDHKLSETEDALTSTKLVPVMDSNTLLETLTDDSNNDSETLMLSASDIQVSKNENLNLETIEETIGADIKKYKNKVENNNKKERIKEDNINQDKKFEAEVEHCLKQKSEIEMKESEGNVNENIQVNAKTREMCLEKGEKTIEVITSSNKELIGAKNKIEKIKNIFSTENANTEVGTHVGKIKKENMEMIDKNIIENMENIEKNFEESLQKIERGIEKKGINVKEFSEKMKDVRNDIKKTHIDNTSLVKNVHIDQDEDSVDDNNDEFNEDHKLIIDEEFIEKESNQDEMQFKIKINDGKKQLECSQKKKIDKDVIRFNEHKVDEKKRIELKYNIEREKIHNKVNIDSSSDKKLNDNIDNSEKSVEFLQERLQKTIKTGLIDELSKLKEESKTIEKQAEENKIIETHTKAVSGIKISIKKRVIGELSEKKEFFVQSLEKEYTENPIKQIKKVVEKELVHNKKVDEKASESHEESDSNDDYYKNKSDDKTRKLCMIYEEGDKTEQELENIFGKDSSNVGETNMILKSGTSKFYTNTSTSQEEEEDDEDEDEDEEEDDDEDDEDDQDDNVDDKEEEKENENSDQTKDELFKSPTTSKGITSNLLTSDRMSILTSPFEEDCHYLESNNQRYLIFKKYLEKLEADPSRSLEDMIESFGGVVVPAMPMAAPIRPLLAKRKHSTSPLTDILITNSNNNNDGSEKESTSEETSENSSNPMKKRKVGRIKKPSGTSGVIANLQQEQQLQPQQHHHQQPPQLQPHQVAIINGENFVMPLSPESDVSATSEKNPGNALKDERSRHRNNQRYSSDDLYKPRPLFSSSSRRNRRFHHT